MKRFHPRNPKKKLSKKKTGGQTKRSDSNEIARSTFQTDEIAAHTSIAGDNLELIAPGASVWENYTIEIILDYTYRDTQYNERWTYNVGSWTMEMFTYAAPMHFL